MENGDGRLCEGAAEGGPGDWNAAGFARNTSCSDGRDCLWGASLSSEVLRLSTGDIKDAGALELGPVW